MAVYVGSRGFYLPPADLEWSLAGVPEQLESDNEEVYRIARPLHDRIAGRL
jgi:hypothetical protein